MKTLLSAIAILFAPLGKLSAEAQEKETRTALVIGCDYKGTALELPSPIADASALAGTLEKQLGFQVTLLPNPSRKQLLEAMDRFGETLGKHGGVGLFYFSGHGAQHEGDNYLIPSSATLGFREDLPTEAVTAERVVTRMEAAGNRVNLLFLDACRNNPLPSSRQKAAMAKGLSGMNAANGMLIGFATARNTVANDSGAGSFYTNALLRHVLTPGLSVTDMLTRVNAEVRKVSGGSQIPFMEVGLSDVFAFVPGGAVPQRLPEAALAVTPSPRPSVSPAADPVAQATKSAPFTNSLGMEFVPVPGTKVLMCRTETRLRDFRAYAQQAGYQQQGGAYVLKVKGSKAKGYSTAWELDAGASWDEPGFAQTDDHPVTCVSWEEAREFCAWLSKSEGRNYRLPTDAEWSAAVGLGKYPWGSAWPPLPQVGNYFDEAVKKTLPAADWSLVAKGYDDGAARTAPGASYGENRLGIFDLSGNAWEWCEDIYRASMNSADALKAFPVLKTEKASDGSPFRVLRGGSWSDDSEIDLRSAYRRFGLPTGRFGRYGFRCVMALSGG